MPNGIDPNETPRSSQHSSPSTILSPTWRQPKTPLTPHRLAKLANALGISTPIPASLNPPSGSSSFLSRSFSESSGPPEHLRRSPTPSVTSSVPFTSSNPTTSKFLLHVIPPMHLPHDSDASNDSDMTPPPSTASGYHTQFRRGTLVPVHPTLQAQLGAIAKEYALPSTTGLVLYLVSSGTASSVQSPASPGAKLSAPETEAHEPGPRLSDDIWRHLWTRVVQAEQRDGNMLPPPRSPTPLSLNAGNSTPFLQQEFNTHLRPSDSPSPSPISPRPSYRLATSPSPPSSISEMRSNSKSAPPSSVSESYAVDSSVNTSITRTDSLDLPGLFSPSLIPILAKVEFDIDRRKAGWYEPWIRSRKANHAKRARSRKNSSAGQSAVENTDDTKEKVPAIPLIIGRKETASPLGLVPADPALESGTEEEEDNEAEDTQVAGYEQLSDTQEGDSDSEDDFGEDSTARVSSIVERKDPLEDVFGSDADTWSELKGGRRSTHEINPNVVDLALEAGDLTGDITGGSFNTDADFTTKEEEEVRDLLDRMSQSEKSTPDPFATLSPQSLSKKIPPPLVLVPDTTSNNVVAAEASPLPQNPVVGTDLAYLNGESPAEHSDLAGEDDGYEYRPRSPAESEKRSGALFEDIDLGLDPYDDDDPNDRRKSQIVMSAQLDEIERTLAQLSPRFMKTDLEEEMNQSFRSISTLSPNSPAKLTLSPLRNSELTNPSRLPQHPDSPAESSAGTSWPAVPFSLIKDGSSTGSPEATHQPSPPQLALNGVTTAAPISFNPRNADDPSSETIQRKKELEEDQAFFRQPQNAAVIPLSPDPFGRFASSTPEIPPPIINGPSGWDTTTVGRNSVTLGEGENVPRGGRTRSGTTASRFSVDSMQDEAPVLATPSTKSNRGTLMSVKSIKNLWRKSNKGDKEKDKAEKAQSASTSGRASPAVPQKPERLSSGRASPATSQRSDRLSTGRVSPGAPQRPERPSQETLDLPDVPPMPSNASFGRVSPQPMPGNSDMPRRPSGENGMPPRAPSSQSNRPPGDYMGMPQQQHHQQWASQQEFPPSRRSQDGQGPPQMMGPGHSLMPHANVTGRTSPIVPAQMLSSRPGAGLDRLRFDQESPYPNPIRNQPQQPPPLRSPPIQQQQQQQQQNGQFSGLPSIPEQEKLARKSILKWKSGSGSSSGSHNHPQQQEPQPRTSFDRASNASIRTNGSGGGGGYGNGRKASVTSFSSSELAPPPSPMLPDHFGSQGRAPSAASSYNEHGGGDPRMRTSASPFESGSPPVHYHRPLGARSVSPAASFASSHASIDESQFEIVSPKLHTGFSYPSATYSGQTRS